MAVTAPRSLALLVAACAATVLGQDIVFQEANFGFNFDQSSRFEGSPGAVEFPTGVEGSEVVLLRFGGRFDCRAPDGQLGRCGAFLDCPVMTEALLPLTTTRLRFLKKSICRFSGGKPLICCPEKPPRLVRTTSAPLIFEDRRRTTMTFHTTSARLTSPVATTPVTPAAGRVTGPQGGVSAPFAASGAPGSQSPASPNSISTTQPEAPTPTAAGLTPPVPEVTTAPAGGPAGVTAGQEGSAPSLAVTAATTPAPPEPGSPAAAPVTPTQVPTATSAATPTATPTAAPVEETTSTAPEGTSARQAVPVPPPSLDVCGHKLVERITGGREALPNSWPWLAALGYELERGKIDFLCGGALITSQHVLTAAHCIKSELRVIRLGDHDLTNDTEVDTVTERGVGAAWPHDKYNNRTLFNDIAVIKLDKPVTFTDTVNPICLPFIPEMRNVNLVRKIAFIAGWGTTKFKGEASPVLREAKVRVHRHQLCKVRYRALRHKLSEKQMCASAREDNVSQDTCQGDSGGPMMMPGLLTPNWYVMGVVSFGFRCGEPRFPGVYTRVTEYLDWIADNLR